jgi:hypothetical protein
MKACCMTMNPQLFGLTKEPTTRSGAITSSYPPTSPGIPLADGPN